MADDIRNKPQQPKLADAPKSSQPVDLEALVLKQSQELAELRAILMATIQSQPKVTPDSLWAKQHQKDEAVREELDRLATHFQTTCQNRTQWEANKLNTDATKLFKVKVGWCPEIVMHANDAVMAKAYYDKLCGINAIVPNHGKPEATSYVIEDVTDDPKSQKLAKGSWQYEAAA